jgi:opacity protein-like surface antigen
LKPYKFGEKWSVGFNIGPSLFYGDVAENVNPFKKKWQEYALGYSLNFSKQIFKPLSINIIGTNAKLTGIREHFKGGHLANQKFNANLYIFSFNAKIDILPFINLNIDKFNFYALGGVGYIYYRSMKRNLITDKYISSIGYDNNGLKKTKMAQTFNYNYGIGLSYSINRHFDVNLNVVYNYSTTDKLDANIGITDKKDVYSFTTAGISYKFNFKTKEHIIIPDKPIEYKFDTNIVANINDTAKVIVPDSNKSVVDIVNKDINIKDTSNKIVESDKYISSIIYKIQIAASRQPVNKKILTDYYNINIPVDEKLFSDGWYRYTIGDFSDPCDAITLRKSIPDNGKGEEVFIVPYIDGVRMLPNVFEPILLSKNYYSTPEKVIEHTTDFKIKESKVFFSVQVFASKDRMGIPIVCSSLPIHGNLIETYSDGYYKYCLGSFSDYAAVKKYLTEVKSSLNKKSFIVAFKDGKPIHVLFAKQKLRNE